MSLYERLEDFARGADLSIAQAGRHFVLWNEHACSIIELTSLPRGPEYKLKFYLDRPGYTLKGSLESVIAQLAHEFVYQVQP